MKNKTVRRAALKIGMLCATVIGLSACYAAPPPPPPPVAYAPAPAYYAPGYYAAPVYPAYGYYGAPAVAVGIGVRGRRW